MQTSTRLNCNNIYYLLLLCCSVYVYQLLILFRIAFDLKPTKYLRLVELQVDIILILNMILTFFTARESDKGLIISIPKLAAFYLKSYFFFDVLANIPGLIVLENYLESNNKRKYFYYFKLMRFIHLKRLVIMLNKISSKIK